MILYIFLIVGIIIGFLLYYSLSFTRTTKNILDKGEPLISWKTSNGVWFTTKLFVISIAMFFLLPRYIDVSWKVSNNKIDSIKETINFINSLEFNVLALEQWSFFDFTFLLIYASLLIYIVNIPLKYTITTNGIYYGILGLEVLSFYSWSEVVCFDITINPSTSLHIWFRPPVFKSDWNINIPRKEANEIYNVFLKKSILYSIAKNEKNERKEEKYE